MKNKDRQSLARESLLSSLDIREWNMKTFAEELYQNTGQLISLARVSLAAIDLEKKEETKEMIRHSEQLLKRVIKDLRNLASQLSPAEIAHKGFLSSLQYESERLGMLGIWEINLSVRGNKFRLDESRELILFSIIQHYILESLYVEKAKKLDVVINFSGSMIKISLFYPVTPELLRTKKINTGKNVLQKAAHIGAVISSKRRDQVREISICVKN